ncbi:hypothetical protein X943_000726 [Babesia divergens]|uniref:Uncharacterized protein n=1 Tax=Babesia divergens TaxID=32595 RepID=A0AAD9LI30_BABDI|nr:hypothetical protein X943_000726 [Babesia divergens]
MKNVGGADSGSHSKVMDTIAGYHRKFLEYIWHFFSDGASVDEFDRYSFVGGVCFGTGTAIILGRVMRNIFLISTGGLVATLSIKTVLEQSAAGARSKIETVAAEASKCALLLNSRLFGGELPRSRVISALLGTATGFGVGLFVF